MVLSSVWLGPQWFRRRGGPLITGTPVGSCGLFKSDLEADENRDRGEAMTTDEKLADMYELLGAIEATIKASDRKTRSPRRDHRPLSEDFPEFFWATGPQAPTYIT
jgi:hypothetical protein